MPEAFPVPCGPLPEIGANIGANPGPHFERIAYNSDGIKENGMTQKIIEVIGTSKESFAKAAEAAVQEAAKTVRGIKWAHVDSLDMQLDGAKVLQYRANAKIYFDVEH
jgi:flavin-binding protein dodecin